MRFVRSLLMLLMLVTFSTGFGKTTTDLKQNSKNKFVVCIDKVFTTQFVNVVNIDYSFGIIDFNLSTNSTNVLKSSVSNLKMFPVITDVGWRNYQSQNKDIPFTEKLIDNYKNTNKLNKIIKEHRIRENPFNNSNPFIIYRR